MGYKEINKIKKHPWCRDIPWEKVPSKKWRDPPIKPNIMKSNFDPEYTSLPVDQT